MTVKAYVVYLIPYKTKRGIAYYCGFTGNPKRRWSEHHQRGFLHHKRKLDMRIVFETNSRRKAMCEEKVIKKYSHEKKKELYESSDIITEVSGKSGR